VAVGIGSFAASMVGSIVSTILPVIQENLQTDTATIQWVMTVYLLIVSGLLLTFGRLADLLGPKKVYISGFFLFTTGSALCGLAYTPGVLIAFRSLQALGSAMLFASSPAILTTNFPPQQRGQVLGLQGTMTYLGLTAGPPIGGFLSQQFGWHSVFIINVPVGLAAILLSLYFIPADRKAEKSERFDPAGALLFIGGLVSLLLALNRAQEWGWSSLPILTLLAASIVLLVTFVLVEGRVRWPMLDLSLFHSRLFSAATTSALINYICVQTLAFLTPFYLIQGRGYTTEEAGLILVAQPVVMAIAAPISGALSDRIGSRILTVLGMLILAGGLFLVSQLGPQSPVWMILLALAVSGSGTGIFISPNSSALMGSAPGNRQGIASGMLATARNAGMALGVGISGAILNSYQSKGSTDAIFGSTHTGFLVVMGFALLGCVVAGVRGNSR